MKKLALLGALAAVVTVALAATLGTFHVSSLGKAWMRTTLAQDAETDYQAANKLAQTYLAPLLRTPGAIAKAIAEDYIRVTYFDGQIASFKIVRWPSSVPVVFDSKIASATQPRYNDATVERVTCLSSSSGPIRISTGYWGSETTWYDTLEGTTVITTGRWISTGLVTIANPTYSKTCVR